MPIELRARADRVMKNGLLLFSFIAGESSPEADVRDMMKGERLSGSQSAAKSMILAWWATVLLSWRGEQRHE
jgi:hypothetical protein